MQRIINILCNKITYYNNSLTSQDILKIQYVIKVILGDVSKFLMLFLLFYVTGNISIYILSFFILISLRMLVGGIHCKTFFSCLLLTIVHFIITVVISNIFTVFPMYVYIVFYIFSFVILLIYAPCPNEKRKIKNKKQLKVVSLIVLTIWNVILFTTTNDIVTNCIFLSISINIIQVIIINIKERLKCKQQ